MMRQQVTSRVGLSTLVVSLVSLALAAGCATEAEKAEANPRPSPPPRNETSDFNVAPKQLFTLAKEVVGAAPWSLSTTDEGKGAFVTGYKTYPGEWHIARRWQERTRFRVVVIPDWDEPTARCRLQVSEETEQRAADVQAWQEAPELQRPERAKELMDAIQAKVKK